MKQILSLILLGLFTFFYSCSSENTSNSTELFDSKDNVTPCCQVQCRLSSCKKMGSPCQCTCVGGMALCFDPSISDNPASKSSMPTVIIESSPDKMPLFDESIRYIANNLHNAKAAQALRNLKQLFMVNNYKIDTPIEIEKYYYNLKVYTDFIETQPEEVVDLLSAIK